MKQAVIDRIKELHFSGALPFEIATTLGKHESQIGKVVRFLPKQWYCAKNISDRFGISYVRAQMVVGRFGVLKGRRMYVHINDGPKISEWAKQCEAEVVKSKTYGGFTREQLVEAAKDAATVQEVCDALGNVCSSESCRNALRANGIRLPYRGWAYFAARFSSSYNRAVQFANEGKIRAKWRQRKDGKRALKIHGDDADKLMELLEADYKRICKYCKVEYLAYSLASPSCSKPECVLEHRRVTNRHNQYNKLYINKKWEPLREIIRDYQITDEEKWSFQGDATVALGDHRNGLISLVNNSGLPVRESPVLSSRSHKPTRLYPMGLCAKLGDKIRELKNGHS